MSDADTAARLERLAQRRRDRTASPTVASSAGPEAGAEAETTPETTPPAEAEPQAEAKPQTQAAATPRARRWRVSRAPVAATMTAGILVAAGVVAAMPAIRTPVESNHADPRRMALIPAGTYRLGGGGQNDTSLPPMFAAIDAFAIDRFEVTNRDFARFTAAERSQTASPPAHAAFPVVGVDHDTASKYCQWAGKRLPTEAEWEIAARGTAGTRFPWGARANAVELPAGGIYRSGTFPENHSDFGVYDTVGNALEWVGRPALRVDADALVLRGDTDALQRLIVGVADPLPERAGFRCAADGVARAWEDSFDGTTAGVSGWPSRVGSDAKVSFVPPSNLELSVRNGARAVALTGITISDGEVEATFADTSLPTKGRVRFGIAARVAAGHGYMFGIDVRERRWVLLRFAGSRTVVVARGDAQSVAAGPITLRIAATGATLDLFVGGALVERVQDRAFDAGDVGLYLDSTLDDDVRVSVDRIAVMIAHPALSDVSGG